MFAFITSRLPVTLLRALRHAKAFALLEDPPPAPPIDTAHRAFLPRPTSCAGDRRRPLRADGVLVRDSDLHLGRDHPQRSRRHGAVARAVQPCHSPVAPRGTASREPRHADGSRDLQRT